MGWLWASPPSPPKPTPPPEPSAPAPKPEESSTDTEFQKFLAELQAGLSTPATKHEVQAPPAPKPSPEPSSTNEGSWSSWLRASSSSSKTITPAPAPEAQPLTGPQLLAESLLPTEMSCRSTFDLAFHCQSLGGQWNAVYREGGLRDCSELWSDFWFCMRIKSYPTKSRENAIREHYRAKEAVKYAQGKPSSEDVWESREAKVPEGTAFTESVQSATVNDEEWRVMELRRRQEIQRALEVKKT